MKKTLIAIATLSTMLTVQAGPVKSSSTSSSEVIEDGGALLIDNRTRIKQYPEINVSNSLEGSGINVVESTEQIQETSTSITETETETIVTEEVINTVPSTELENQEIVKRTGEITIEQAKDGYTAAKTEKVYTKKFLGIPYSPVNVVVEPSQPIFFGYLYFNNLTCSNGYNNGRIDLYSHHSHSIIPIIFCPNDTEAKIELKVETFPDDHNKAVVLLGGQKINVEKGYTSLYNLRYDDHNVANIEFIFHQDEHPIRY